MHTLDYLPFLKKLLTPRRLRHSLAVMHVMDELAAVYAIDQEKAMTAGLLHDAAKDLSPSKQAEVMRRANLEIRDVYDLDYVHYFHGPVGACLVRQEFGVTDSLILDAIAMHGYYGQGENFTAPLCWCLRFADVLEPNRNWSGVPWLGNGVERLRDVVYAGRMTEGAYLQTGWLIKWFTEEGILIHPNMRRVHQELATALNVDESFLVSAAA